MEKKEEERRKLGRRNRGEVTRWKKKGVARVPIEGEKKTKMISKDKRRKYPNVVVP